MIEKYCDGDYNNYSILSIEVIGCFFFLIMYKNELLST